MCQNSKSKEKPKIGHCAQKTEIACSTQNSELRNLFMPPLDYRFSTKHNQIIIMFKIGVWETSVKTKSKVAGTDASACYPMILFSSFYISKLNYKTFQNLIIVKNIP